MSLRNTNFHGGFTEIFIDVGVTWVLEIQYCFLREKTNVKLFLTYSISIFKTGCRYQCFRDITIVTFTQLSESRITRITRITRIFGYSSAQTNWRFEGFSENWMIRCYSHVFLEIACELLYNFILLNKIKGKIYEHNP